ncbi:serine/threonine protein kinase [Paenibacillus sp. CAA11]|uniref:serine/threonine-protein kinase n=1 Tax=Paenibacillus sp. CAA11 TaxID=1532905 RepID=UPI000D39B312|nr:serine/threonine-protein kinase [Paenibacillus sp. CAA11]AWB44862.1 serine/threonine protein kinase [Paenibacillus sp. CAA11]
MKLPQLLQPGTIIGNRYKVVRPIGHGGTSRVYAAADLRLPGKIWAVKQSVAETSSYAYIEEEATMLITLQHPRLPRIVDFFPPGTEGETYLIMDLIDGVTLEQTVRTTKQVTEQTLIKLGEQICEGLDYLHSRQPAIIYRDLKPSNLMIQPNGELRFIDFGTAREYKAERTEDTVQLGTIGFAAPEQYGGSQTDGRTDLYALGAILLYAATSGRYSEWNFPQDEIPGIQLTPSFVKVIRKLLQYKPENRFQSAQEVMHAFRSVSPPASSSSYSGLTRPIVIAVMGTAHGVGTTHTAILLSHALKARYSKLTLMDWEQKSKAFERIGQVLADREYGQSFEIEGVQYIRRSNRNQLLSLLGSGEGAVVLDLGSSTDKEGLEEFLRADLQIIVSSPAIWKCQELDELRGWLEQHPSDNRYYCFPAADERAISVLQRTLEIEEAFAVPSDPNPFEPRQLSRQWAEQVCSKLTGGTEPPRRGLRRLWRGMKFDQGGL